MNQEFQELLKKLWDTYSKDLQQCEIKSMASESNLKFEIEAAKLEADKLKDKNLNLQNIITNERLKYKEIQAQLEESLKTIQLLTRKLPAKSDDSGEHANELINDMIKTPANSLQSKIVDLEHKINSQAIEHKQEIKKILNERNYLHSTLKRKQQEWSIYKEKMSKTKLGMLLLRKKKVKEEEALHTSPPERKTDFKTLQPIENIIITLDDAENISAPLATGLSDQKNEKENDLALKNMPQQHSNNINNALSANETTFPCNDSQSTLPDLNNAVVSDDDVFPVSKLKRTRSLSHAENQPWAFKTKHEASRPNYAFQEVVRNKDERRKMHASDCPCCRDYYKATGLPDKIIQDGRLQDRIGLVSRHRYWHKNPETPPGFWDIDYSVLYSSDDGDEHAKENNCANDSKKAGKL